MSDLLPVVDFVSLHAVRTQSPRRAIGSAELGMMKSSTVLINVSRLTLVDEALMGALVSPDALPAGLDVFSRNPCPSQATLAGRLFTLPNVLLMHSPPFYTRRAGRLGRNAGTCDEIIEGRPVLVKSHDARLRSQSHGVVFG